MKSHTYTVATVSVTAHEPPPARPAAARRLFRFCARCRRGRWHRVAAQRQRCEVCGDERKDVFA